MPLPKVPLPRRGTLSYFAFSVKRHCRQSDLSPFPLEKGWDEVFAE